MIMSSKAKPRREVPMEGQGEQGNGHKVSYNEYVAWAQGPTCGLKFHQPGVVLRDADHEGERGVFTTQSLPPNVPILSLPFSSLLTVESIVSTSPLRPLLTQDPPLREDDILVIALLWEKSLAERSKWAPHILLLPQHIPSAVTLSEEGVERLKGSSLYPTALQLHHQIRADFAELSVRRLIHLPEEAEPATLLSMPWWTLDGYVWALSNVWSRCVSITRHGRSLKSLCPFFDMLNHDPSRAMVHGFSAADERLYLLTGPQGAVPGELCISYGPLSNARLLMLYGFAIPNNPYDTLPFWVSMHAQAPHYEIKAAALARHGLAHCLTEPLALSLHDPLPTTLLASLRIQRASLSELASSETALHGPLSPDNEAEVRGVLRSAISGLLSELGTADNQRGAEPVEVYLEAERAILKAALQALELMEMD